MSLARCGRCDRVFDQIRSPVCPRCLKDENHDYAKIREVLYESPGLAPEEVAERAEVSRACVMRMIDEGEIADEGLLPKSVCGICGAPAIGVGKRLCERCLMRLDNDVRDTISKMREKMEHNKRIMFIAGQPGPAHAEQVHDALRKKRRKRVKGRVTRDWRRG